MFDRLIRLRQAQTALDCGRIEDALRMLADPGVADSRRGRKIRLACLAALAGRRERRVARLDWSGALADGQLLIDRSDAPDEHRARQAEIAAARDARRARTTAEEQVASAARQDLMVGDLARAEQRLAAAGDGAAALDRVWRELRQRRTAAADALRACELALAERRSDTARQALETALANDGAADPGGVMRTRVLELTAGDLVVALRDDIERGALAQAVRRLVSQHADLTGLASTRAEVAGAASRLDAAVRSSLAKLVGLGGWADAAALLDSFDPRAVTLPGFAEVVALAETFRYLAAVSCIEDLSRVLEAQRRISAVLGGGHGVQHLATLERQARQVAFAREDVARLRLAGRIDEAKKRADEAIANWPGCRSLERELRLCLEGDVTRDLLVAQARDLLERGALTAAEERLAALDGLGQGRLVDGLRADLAAKKAGVEARLAVVRGALGEAGALPKEQLTAVLQELDDLDRVQLDNGEISRLRKLVVAEQALHRQLDSWASALDNHAITDVTSEIRSVTDAYRPLPGRLALRFADLADRALAVGARACGTGRIAFAAECVRMLEALALIAHVDSAGLARLRSRVLDVQAEALRAVERAKQALRAGKVLVAESELRPVMSVDLPEVSRCRQDISALARSAEIVDAVDARIDDGDWVVARRRLASIPVIPQMRTKIFNLRQNLARAQGLDRGFVLRVDEGGEFMVFRQDSLSIGNLKGGRADIPILAAISADHARLQRRMSFHGGMEDRIVADKGEIRVGGQIVKDHRLKHGDEVGLSAQLRLSYRLPSKRSLSAVIKVLGGFSVWGTDRIVLMKDRGRDGRIIIGNVADAHVPVACDSPEVEIYATNDGQICVRWTGDTATMDGRPFQGEHPVTPGALIVCGGVQLVLLPLPSAELE